MKIIVDDKIPYIREVLERITKDVRYIKGADITHDDLTDADALIVRTRTRCNRQLLEHTNVKFVATATIGIDHLYQLPAQSYQSDHPIPFSEDK